MKKLFSIFAATLFAATMSAVTFTASDFKGKGTADTGSDVSVTKDGVTVSATRAFGADAELRVYAANAEAKLPAGVLTVTADKKIVKIAAEFGKNTKGKFAEQEPNATEWSITAEKQFRITKLVVTREGEEEEVIEPAKNLGPKTIAEFLTLKNDKDTCVLTGVVANIEMDKNDKTKYNAYGNFDLIGIDGDKGQVYVYGLLTAAGEKQKFNEMDIDASDTLTIKAVYAEYKENPQAQNAVFVSVKKGPGGNPDTGGEGDEGGEGDLPEGVITCAAAAELANALATPEVGKSTTGTQSVTIRGYVIFAYDMKDGKQDAWLADNAGAKSGAIQAYKATVTSAVAKGDYVEATGTVAKYYKKGKDGKENEIILELVNGTMKKVSGEGGEGGEGDEEYEFSYEYEPDATTVTSNMVFMSLADYTEKDGTVYIVMSDDPDGDVESENEWAEFEFVATSFDESKGIPVGTYQISNSGAAGTFVASPGMEVESEYDYPSYYAYLDDDGNTVSFYLVSGTVTVAASEKGVKVEVKAKSYYGSDVTINYEGMPSIDEPIDDDPSGDPDDPGDQAIDNVSVDNASVKVMKDGHLYIIRGGKTFNALGAQVK